MARIVRRRTVGRAQDLYNDLTENLAHVDDYASVPERERDSRLAVLLSKWLLAEIKREAQVDE